jgi:hypothetical protein
VSSQLAGVGKGDTVLGCGDGGLGMPHVPSPVQLPTAQQAPGLPSGDVQHTASSPQT